MARNPWHDLHFTEARARAIVEATIDACIDWMNPDCFLDPVVRLTIVKQGMTDGMKDALAITYPPSVRGAMGGHAKQRVLDAKAAEMKARRLADRKRKARSRAAAKERLAILRLHEEEQRIGHTKITR